MIEVWKHYHVYDPKVISPTFQRARSRRKMYQIQRLHPGDGVRGPIVLLLLYSPSRMEQPASLSNGVEHYQYIQESFGQTLGWSSTEVRLPRNHIKPPNTCHECRGVARGAAGYICPRAPRYSGAKMRLTKLSQG